MIKFVKQKSRDNSIKTTTKNFLKKKSESNDSGTESDGDILDAEKHQQQQQQQQMNLDMETSLSSPCVDGSSPTDTACCAPASTAAMMCQSHLLYDQHSSEEELEVINGPSSVAAVEASAHSNVLVLRTTASSSLISERGSIEPDDLYGEASTSKRSSSTMIENRKRSLAHSSDDELRNFLEPILTPVNFRTSPPLEAFKPHRSHMYRSTTPLILSEARCGIENIQLCDNSVNEENGIATNTNTSNNTSNNTGNNTGNNISGTTSVGDSKTDDGKRQEEPASAVRATALKVSTSSHHIYQPLPKYTFQYSSSRSSPASTTCGLVDAAEVRSVSPPAKLFHCAISPRRRPIRNQSLTATAIQAADTAATTTTATTSSAAASSSSSSSAGSAASGQTTTGEAAAGAAAGAAAVTAVATATTATTAQRLQRPHRPCLDFDKMQQVSL